GGGRGVLIVDDLVDTGKTARVVRDLLPDAHFATVYAKPMGRPLVDTFITEVSQDTWIVFPWDSGLAFQPPIRAEGGQARAPGQGGVRASQSVRRQRVQLVFRTAKSKVHAASSSTRWISEQWLITAADYRQRPAARRRTVRRQHRAWPRRGLR